MRASLPRERSPENKFIGSSSLARGLQPKPEPELTHVYHILIISLLLAMATYSGACSSSSQSVPFPGTDVEAGLESALARRADAPAAPPGDDVESKAGSTTLPPRKRGSRGKGKTQTEEIDALKLEVAALRAKEAARAEDAVEKVLKGLSDMEAKIDALNATLQSEEMSKITDLQDEMVVRAEAAERLRSQRDSARLQTIIEKGKAAQARRAAGLASDTSRI